MNHKLIRSNLTRSVGTAFLLNVVALPAISTAQAAPHTYGMTCKLSTAVDKPSLPTIGTVEFGDLFNERGDDHAKKIKGSDHLAASVDFDGFSNLTVTILKYVGEPVVDSNGVFKILTSPTTVIPTTNIAQSFVRGADSNDVAVPLHLEFDSNISDPSNIIVICKFSQDGTPLEP